MSLTHFKSLTLLTWSAVYLVLVYGLDVERERQAGLESRALSHQAQLEMLRNQLSPHFLFNALNSMSVLIREDPARAEQMLDELSEFLRYSLASTKVQEATLADEVDVIRRYLAIQQIRFEEKLQVTWDVDERVLSCPVPAFLLHPLVENAVKYGMQTSALPLQVGIRIERADGVGAWSSTCRTPARGFRLMESSGTAHHLNGAGLGLEIVRRRLEQRYPDTHSLVIGERQGRVHAVVELPPAPPESPRWITLKDASRMKVRTRPFRALIVDDERLARTRLDAARGASRDHHCRRSRQRLDGGRGD